MTFPGDDVASPVLHLRAGIPREQQRGQGAGSGWSLWMLKSWRELSSMLSLTGEGVRWGFVSTRGGQFRKKGLEDVSPSSVDLHHRAQDLTWITCAEHAS